MDDNDNTTDDIVKSDAQEVFTEMLESYTFDRLNSRHATLFMREIARLATQYADDEHNF